MQQERRKHRRIDCSLVVQLKDRRGTSELMTSDISRHGVFVLTDSPKNERELVQLTFQLGAFGSVEVIGKVARRVLPAEADEKHPPGMGVEFFALSAEDKNRWDDFVLKLQEGAAEAPPDGEAKAPPIRRRHPRHIGCFLVQLRDKQRMREFYTRDISTGGMFLRTPSPGQVSEDVRLVLVHPETKEEFPLAGRVVREVSEGPLEERGVGIAFEELDEERETALLAFIETGLNYLNAPEDAGDERLGILRKAVRMAGDSKDALVRLGQALLNELETEIAVEAFSRALAMDPGDARVHQGLYKAYTMLGEEDRAAPHLEAMHRLERPDAG